MLVPSVLCDEPTVPDISALVETYSDDLPSPERLYTELRMWRERNLVISEYNRANTVVQSLKLCDKYIYPNIHELLVIAATLPATSAECERSFSVLRRLNSYLRASMTVTRLSGLALMHIHYTMPIDLDRVVDLFATYHPDKLRKINLVYT